MQASRSKGLAVALIITALFAFGCEVERENDNVIDLAQDGDGCGQSLQIWVNSLTGGTVTCDGFNHQFLESAWIRGFCEETHGFWFTVDLSGPATLTVTVNAKPGSSDGGPDAGSIPNGGVTPTPSFALDFKLPDGNTVRADFIEVGAGGGMVVVTVP